MDRSERSLDPVERLRRWILWIFAFGLAGAEAELVLLKHYEDPWQFVPLSLIPLAAAALIWHVRQRDAASLRALRILMVLFLIAGFAGFGFHFRGAAQFQLEANPEMGRWELVGKVMRAEAPPVLAPGVMLQLGLIGLAYVLSGSRDSRSEMP